MARLGRLRDVRRRDLGRHLADGDLHVVDPPAGDAAAAVATDVEAELDRVTALDVEAAEVHDGRPPLGGELATVGAGEGRLARHRVGTPRRGGERRPGAR